MMIKDTTSKITTVQTMTIMWRKKFVRRLFELFLCVITAPSSAKIIGTFVIPHGDFAYDPSLVNNTNGSRHVHRAAVALGAAIANARPDIVLLSTPHGVAADRDFLLYENSAAEGYADVGLDLQDPVKYPPYRVDLSNVSMDGQLATALVQEGRSRGLNVSGLLSFGDDQPQQLGWGEVIPLSFLNATLQTGGSRVVVVSSPSRRYSEEAESMVQELLTMGRFFFDYLDNAINETVAVVASADLAHTHLQSGPYGYSPAAEPFDLAVGAWAATLEGTWLTDTAAALADDALSCGFTGMVMIQGLIAASQEQEQQQKEQQQQQQQHAREGSAVVGSSPSSSSNSSWSSFLLADRHPTYYGMMVAAALPPDDEDKTAKEEDGMVVEDDDGARRRRAAERQRTLRREVREAFMFARGEGNAEEADARSSSIGPLSYAATAAAAARADRRGEAKAKAKAKSGTAGVGGGMVGRRGRAAAIDFVRRRRDGY
jgi:aromatic ring-opening dioxygenase LigB subunit